MREFLVRIDVDLPEPEIAALVDAERTRGRELIAAGAIHRIWRVPAEQGLHNVGIWRADSVEELRRLIDGLPMGPWLRAEITPVEPHPLEADS